MSMDLSVVISSLGRQATGFLRRSPYTHHQPWRLLHHSIPANERPMITKARKSWIGWVWLLTMALMP
jgi:hypothetical protein